MILQNADVELLDRVVRIDRTDLGPQRAPPAPEVEAYFVFPARLGQATFLNVKRLAKRAEERLRRLAVEVAHRPVVSQDLHLVVREEHG